ncbi:hypothetical protein GV828_06650 [Flavobacterium sp. NST-5]|uniref:histidine kinase n=1 Tax=Flavobacterium ichthyis TaxID=2698827 RepID=A0ABW9Z7N4_9FLAO|nr:CHASE3 domain-containing protein [Flavobacterium ichthyis]NBL64878.1 hypothetical protein [Flavobacterium ichthyis]
MKNLSLKSIIDITFITILFVFAILGYSIYNRAEMVKQNRLLVNRTSNINATLEKMLSSTIDIETGSRGFTITGEDNYLEVYDNGRIELKTWIDSLKSMNETDASKLEKLDSIEVLIQNKANFSSLMIKTRKEKGMTEAISLVQKGRGRALMDSIRISIENYQQEALSTLEQALRETEENVQARNNNFFWFSGISFLLLGFSYYKIRQNATLLVREKEIQKNLLDELSYQNLQLNDFANITSHNLRAPAANITALISTLDEKSNVEEFQTVFQLLKKVAENLNESLNQLMEVLHIKKNKKIEKELLSFQEIYTKTIETLQGIILQSGAKFIVNFNDVPEIVYSRIYLESIFHNLISNAIKYKSADRIPEISISTHKTENSYCLKIQDNGLGIDLEKYGDKIFGMHQIFHNHPDAKGVGLFMTKAQIESLKGKISVESKAGKGTTFTVYF